MIGKVFIANAQFLELHKVLEIVHRCEDRSSAYMIGKVFIAQFLELHEVLEIVHRCEDRSSAIYNWKSVYSQCTISRTS